MQPYVAFNIDTKMDDGFPLSGNIRAFHIQAPRSSGTGGIPVAQIPGTHWGDFFSGGIGTTGSQVCVANDVTPNQYNASVHIEIPNDTWFPSNACGLAFKAPF